MHRIYKEEHGLCVGFGMRDEEYLPSNPILEALFPKAKRTPLEWLYLC